MSTGPTPHRSPGRLPAPALLQLMRLASPSLPVGGFSYSDGFEAAFEAGQGSSEPAALAWLLDQLHLGLARSDLPAVAHATRAWKRHDASRIAELNAWVTMTRETSEARQQGEQMGRSMAQWLKQHEPPDARLSTLIALRPAPTWPIAFALAGAAANLRVGEVLLAFAAGWAENMTQAAMKTIPLGQAAGQRLLAGLSAAIPAAVLGAARLRFDGMQAFTPMLAILSSQHEAQYSRLFRS
ncbi:MAG: urease accessory protein UreF [Pseudomonadota bacterium]|nr:urease accessory protein UreF [Pseudomonadota bacterium]